MPPEPNIAPEIAFLIDFNLHRVPAALGLPIPTAAGAAMVGVSEAEFNAYAATVAAEVENAARDLLTQPSVALALSKLSGKVMTVGDSITAYRRSYAELLGALFRLHKPTAELVNVAQSGYTSTHGLEITYTQFIAQQPDWAFIMFGANDCKRFGVSGKTLVSLDEYRANMTGMVTAFRQYTKARIVLLTPPPIVEATTGANPDYGAVYMMWQNSDLAACAAVVRDIAAQHGALLVDLFAAFTAAPDPALYLPDGLHPNFDGQKMMLAQVVKTLGGV